MSQKTGVFTVNGTSSLRDLLKADGFTGGPRLDNLVLYPANPAQAFYVNLGISTTPPVDGTEGQQIGAGGIADDFDYQRAPGGEMLDAGTTFLHTIEAVDIKYAVIGE